MAYDIMEVEIVFDDLKERIKKTISGYVSELNNMRAGRANVHILDGITAEYYGTETPLNQLGNITVPEARIIMITVWDASVIKKVEKALVDAKRGKLWSKLAKAIIVAAKQGGGNPDDNIRLRAAIDEARAVSLPKENITRAIKRGTGELDPVELEEVLYEGYGPNGIAVMAAGLTDNRNRTAPEIRKIFEVCGGKMGQSGCVSWNFDKKGVIEIASDAKSEEEMMDLDKYFVKSELIPAIVQEKSTGEVLMLAYMNRESMQLTLETGFTWFWSRSRQELWNKGATSGHLQKVIDIYADCDDDTLLITVEQTGAACHTGSHSCFFKKLK